MSAGKPGIGPKSGNRFSEPPTLKQDMGSPRVREGAGRPGRALLLVPLLGLLWGFNWPAVRISLIEIAPWTLRAAGMSFAGLALGIAGLICLGLPLILAGQLSFGLMLALCAAVSWAFGTIVTKRWPVSAPALTIAAWQLLIGGVVAGIGMLVFEGLPVPKLLSPRVLTALSFHIIGAQALAYFLWFTVVARLPAGIASLGTLMVPAVGVLGSVLLLGERPTPTDWLGLCLVIAASGAILVPARRA